ncbi:MAG: hypothetical protein LW822_03985 [Phycisphaeraceae bacterium]|jgi:hypothetical protein|nr:hypothetical protein [Phycisphaeraceae bacterium]
MPRKLTAPHGVRTYSNLQWGLLVKLAFDHGWKPWGVRPPEDWIATTEEGTRRWHFMDYFSPKGQRIVAGDAQEMGRSVLHALPDIPLHDALSHKVAQEIQLPDVDEPLRMLQPGVTVNAYEFFSGSGRKTIEDFAAFCRAGGFAIGGSG